MPAAPPPSFSAPALRRWSSLTPELRRKILENVWCAHCVTTVKIVDFSGGMRSGHLVLEGRCDQCGGSVARMVESS